MDINPSQPPVPAAPATQTEPPELLPPPPLPELTLDDVAPGRQLHGTPLRTHDGTIVVVLGRTEHDPSRVHVWRDRARPTVLPVSTPGTRVTDPRLVLGALTCAFATQVEALRDLQAEHAYTVATHARVLDEIRVYSIDRYLDGTISRPGLDHFLDHFQMNPYVTRYRVTYEVTGHYDVEDNDPNLDSGVLCRDAEDNIHVDLGTIEGLVHDSDSFAVQAIAEPVPTDGP